MAKPRDPYDVPLSDEQRKCLATFLCDQIQRGLDARASNEVEVDYWWQLYEQARTRTGRNAPWPDAADLTSYLPSEKTDALHARIMRTIWSDPVWTVEGWGDAANRAPFVEEFHQAKVEEERLQSVIDRLCLQALVEPRGLLEVSEGTEVRTTRKTISAKAKLNDQGGLIYDGDDIVTETSPDGTLMEAGPQDYAVDTVVDHTERIRSGPTYRILPYRDSLILPAHARDKDDIWGYAKRFWRTHSEVVARADAKIYDSEAVSQIHPVGDRETGPSLQRALTSVEHQDSQLSSVELWEPLLLLDLNELFASQSLPKVKKLSGRRWYLFTVHMNTQQLLRVQHDDMERSRFIPVILFPRIDRATEGYSLIGHKLITTAEEHTAWRNMTADRGSMILQSPIKRRVGALWDPTEQPWGPKAVIDVRDPTEIEPVAVPDLTNVGFQHMQMLERTAERLVGINDIASGQMSTDSRTLGEVQMATEQSFVRMDLVVRRFQESMEDLAQIRHAIWKRVLAERQEGVDAPPAMVSNLEGRGVSIDQQLPDKKITAALLSGSFRFKPHGSVETADPNKLRQDWVQGMQALPMLLQAFPMAAPMFGTPEAARAMARTYCRVFRVENAQAILGSAQQDLEQTILMQRLTQMVQQQMAGPGGPMLGPGGPSPGGSGPPGPPAPPMTPMGNAPPPPIAA